MQTIAPPSVQSLLIEMQFNGQRLAQGTAFVVQSAKGPHLITNRHNVTGRDQKSGMPLSSNGGLPTDIVILHNRKDQLGKWVSRSEPLYIEGAPRWFEHPTLGAKADFVALPLTVLNDVELYPYDMDNVGIPISVGPADPISVIGFPFGMTGGGTLAVWATGFLASEPEIDVFNLPILLIDCRSRPGQSGSPVIAYRNGRMVGIDGSDVICTAVWKFIGIYSGRINPESDIGIVWKASAIQRLVQSL